MRDYSFYLYTYVYFQMERTTQLKHLIVFICNKKMNVFNENHLFVFFLGELC